MFALRKVRLHTSDRLINNSYTSIQMFILLLLLLLLVLSCCCCRWFISVGIFSFLNKCIFCSPAYILSSSFAFSRLSLPPLMFPFTCLLRLLLFQWRHLFQILKETKYLMRALRNNNNNKKNAKNVFCIRAPEIKTHATTPLLQSWPAALLC